MEKVLQPVSAAQWPHRKADQRKSWCPSEKQSHIFPVWTRGGNSIKTVFWASEEAFVLPKGTYLFEEASNIPKEIVKKSKASQNFAGMAPASIYHFTVWSGTYNRSKATDASICNRGILNIFAYFQIPVYISILGPETVQAYIKIKLWLNLYE